MEILIKESCSVCGKPRKVEIDGVERICACDCEVKIYEQKIEAEQKKIKFEKFEKLQSASLIGERYKDVTFESTQLNDADESFKIAYNRCKKFCDNFEQVKENGYGIYLYGDCGVGKTHLTACIVNELSKKLVPTLFTNMCELIRKSKNDEFCEKVSIIDLLIIDDIGIEKLQFNGEETMMQLKIYEIINRRYNEKKPTIFTSNLTLAQLQEKGMSPRIVNRIMSLGTAKIEIKGKDFRRNKENLMF